jgi:hypothetical protein
MKSLFRYYALNFVKLRELKAVRTLLLSLTSGKESRISISLFQEISQILLKRQEEEVVVEEELATSKTTM